MPTFPSITSVAIELIRLKKQITDEFKDEEGNIGFDVRLQIFSRYDWKIWDGDSSYDTDHRGFCGIGFLTPETNCYEMAKDLIGECKDHAAQ